MLPGILLLTGILPGVILLAMYGLLALYTQLIIIECAHRSNVSAYEQMAAHSMGKIGEFLLAFFVAISCLTGNCGHIATVGGLLHDIIEWFFTGENDSEFSSSKTIILYAVMLSLTFPWLFKRSLHGLSGVGTLSVVVVMMTAVSLIFVCLGKLMGGEGASGEKAPVYGFEKVATAQFWITDLWRACPVWFKTLFVAFLSQLVNDTDLFFFFSGRQLHLSIHCCWNYFLLMMSYLDVMCTKQRRVYILQRLFVLLCTLLFLSLLQLLMGKILKPILCIMCHPIIIGLHSAAFC